MQEKNMGHICPIGRSGVNDKETVHLGWLYTDSHSYQYYQCMIYFSKIFHEF